MSDVWVNFRQDAIAGSTVKRSQSPMSYDESVLFCFSHLRWDFVYQRPQHLLSRFANDRAVYFFEEPFFADDVAPSLEALPRAGATILRPHLPHGLTFDQINEAQEKLLSDFLEKHGIENYLFWYYTPMAYGFTSSFSPLLTVYDCMDELSHFKGAPPELCRFEDRLFERADIVFTGGRSLFEVKRHRHPNVHCFPSSIDKRHFGKARFALEEPADQARIPGPRIGFFGVLDERLDIELLRETAALNSAWHFVLIGPVVKIDPANLPTAPNLHYLGGKTYEELPRYLAGWDVAMLPFARNDATRFISPTKTPEYLSAGKPVVSTSIQDVVSPYGELSLVRIADSPEDFSRAIADLLDMPNRADWETRVDEFLAEQSWDETWSRMNRLMSGQAARYSDQVGLN